MVDLRPMTEDEYRAWLAADFPRYAEAMVRAGYWAEERAFERSRADHDRLLPQGLATPDHYLYMIEESELGAGVGVPWLGVDRRSKRPSGFIYDLFVEGPHRRRGYATGAMRAPEDKARELGLSSLALHVSASKEGARRLYERLGYAVRGFNMGRPL